MEGGGGSGIGGFPGASGNLLDAAAQAFYPAVGAPYPLQPLPHQIYYPHPYPAMPAPAPAAMAVPVPVPQMAMALAPPQPGYTLPTSTPVVDGPSSRVVLLGLVPPHAQEADVAQAMAPFGAIRSVDASAVASEGVATVHFYDIRAAELAVACVREQHMRQQSRLGQLYAAAATVSPAWPTPPTPELAQAERAPVAEPRVRPRAPPAARRPAAGARRGRRRGPGELRGRRPARKKIKGEKKIKRKRKR